MADSVPVSVAPSDSVSQVPSGDKKKKSRPGKNARAAARAPSAAPSSSVALTPSDSSKVSTFALRSASAPVPQPGKFPVVFQVGAGEPTSTRSFSYSPSSINDIIDDLHEKYVNSSRFAEFSSYAEYTESTFQVELVKAFLLSLAQQTVHAHVNMGLPLGDFSSIASTDVYLPSALRSVVQQFGELPAPSLGTRFLLKDYSTTVASLVFAASKVHTNDDASSWFTDAVERLWLPMNATDQRTRFILATRLVEKILHPKKVHIDIDALTDSIVTGTNAAFDAIKPLLGSTDDERKRFDFLFTPLPTTAAWSLKFRESSSQAVLAELGLKWASPQATHLDFNFVPKVSFPSQVEAWARKRATMAKFFSLGSGLANRNAATGSMSQFSTVQTDSGVTKVKTLLALTANEFSLLSCFPASAVCSVEHQVVLVTAIPVKVRSIEFTQLDWL